MSSQTAVVTSEGEKPKRKWCYLMAPRGFDMSNCPCGNSMTEWSEFEKHLWCRNCDKDFIPEHAGVFDGPIPIKAAYLMGICFDRYNIETSKVEYLNIDTMEYSTEKPTSQEA